MRLRHVFICYARIFTRLFSLWVTKMFTKLFFALFWKAMPPRGNQHPKQLIPNIEYIGKYSARARIISKWSMSACSSYQLDVENVCLTTFNLIFSVAFEMFIELFSSREAPLRTCNNFQRNELIYYIHYYTLLWIDIHILFIKLVESFIFCSGMKFKASNSRFMNNSIATIQTESITCLWKMPRFNSRYTILV